MKVCDLALYSPITSSGVKTYIQSKIDYARTRDDIEHVVIVPGQRPGGEMQGRSKVIVVQGVRSFYPGIRVAMNPCKVATIVEREHPDIIELNCQYTLPWAAFLATQRSRTPIVGIYHTDVPACVRHMARGTGNTLAAWAEWLIEQYEGVIYRHCTMTVILNPNMRDRVRRLGVDRVRCLPCGVDATTFSWEKRDPAWRSRWGIAPESRVLLYVGRLSPEKEVDMLFEAHRRLVHEGFILAIVGDGPDADATSRYARMHPGIRYVGHIESRAALATAYASSDIFLSPCRNETFGMATLEAIACGLPVVGIAGSGTAAFVPTDIGMFSTPGAPAEFADAVRTVAAWPLDRSRQKFHTFAATHYSWNRVLDQYFDLYRSMIQVAGEAIAS